MNDKERNKIQSLIAVYERRVNNIEWHVKTNKPAGIALNQINQRLRDHKDFLFDLYSLVSPKPTYISAEEYFNSSHTQ